MLCVIALPVGLSAAFAAGASATTDPVQPGKVTFPDDYFVGASTWGTGEQSEDIARIGFTEDEARLWSIGIRWNTDESRLRGIRNIPRSNIITEGGTL